MVDGKQVQKDYAPKQVLEEFWEETRLIAGAEPRLRWLLWAADELDMIEDLDGAAEHLSDAATGPLEMATTIREIADRVRDE